MRLFEQPRVVLNVFICTATVIYKSNIEKVRLPSGLISGSGSQLWTSAAFMNVCLRAKLVDLK
jgi:hypothetical protein